MSASPSPPPVLPVVTAAWQPLGFINFYAAGGVQERIGATTHSHRKILGQGTAGPSASMHEMRQAAIKEAAAARKFGPGYCLAPPSQEFLTLKLGGEVALFV